MKRKSYAGISTMSDTANVNAERIKYPIRQATRKFSLGTVLRRLSTSTLFKRDTNLDNQLTSEELSESECEDDDGEFHINSSSWEYINKSDEGKNVHFENSFKSKHFNSHDFGLSNDAKLYKYECDSGISTLD